MSFEYIINYDANIASREKHVQPGVGSKGIRVVLMYERERDRRLYDGKKAYTPAFIESVRVGGRYGLQTARPA